MSAARPSVSVVRLPHAEGLPMPRYATEMSAGMDLCAAVEHAVVLHPMQRLLVPTGIKIALPEGYEAQIRPRSGLTLKHGVTVANAPGTVDADYRGEIKVILVNISDVPYCVERGERIAQMVVAQVARAQLDAVEALEDTARGEGGFGSTGGKAPAFA
ncbi:MAG: dUTP diphosphatase [Rickettsiales bacterium]